MQVAKTPRKSVIGYDAGADLIGDEHDRSGATIESPLQLTGVAGDVRIRENAIAEPERQAVDQERVCRRRRRDCLRQVVGYLDGLPPLATLGTSRSFGASCLPP